LYPAWIGSLFRVTGIFESAPSRWRIFFIEMKDGNGWHQINEKSMFAPTPLGNRTRFQQLMNDMEDKQPEQEPKILKWIVNHLRQTNSTYSNISAIRIIHFGVPSEAFLQCASLADVYSMANKTNMPRVVVASMDVNPLYETH